MIKVIKNRVILTGKEETKFLNEANRLGLKPKTFLTALIYKKLLEVAEDQFLKKRKGFTPPV